MIWIIPIAGKGTRTRLLGPFKPFIKIGNKTVLEWFLFFLSIKLKLQDRMLFITTSEYEKKFDVNQNIKKTLNKLNIKLDFDVIAKHDLQKGQSLTIYNAKEYLTNNSNTPVVVINPDQIIDFTLPGTIETKTGYLPLYAEYGNKSSYVKIDKKGFITKVSEKENLANLASAGVYIFDTCKSLLEAIEKQIHDSCMFDGEFYIALSINYLLENKYKLLPLQVHMKYDLGNVESIKYFKNTFCKTINKLL